MILRTLTLSAITVFALANAATAVEKYTCEITNNKARGWVMKDYIIWHEPNAKTAMILDAMIQREDGEPREVKVTADNDNRIRMGWTIKTTSSEGQKATMVYNATYFKKKKRFQVSAKPSGYRNSFHGTGVCVIE